MTNQISESSGRAYIECSFTSFDKRKRSRHKNRAEKKAARNVSLITMNKMQETRILIEKKTQNNNNEIAMNHYTFKGSLSKADYLNNELNSKSDASQITMNENFNEANEKVKTKFSQIIQMSTLKTDIYWTRRKR